MVTTWPSGSRQVRELLRSYSVETSPGDLLRAVGHHLTTAVGGASGPVYGTALIEAGLIAGIEPALDWQQIGRMLDAAAAGSRGEVDASWRQDNLRYASACRRRGIDWWWTR